MKGAPQRLSSIYLLSPAEALTVLEERLDLVVRSQELLARPSMHAPAPADVQALISDHMRILLTAEHIWLEHAIAQLHQRCGVEVTEPARDLQTCAG